MNNQQNKLSKTIDQAVISQGQCPVAIGTSLDSTRCGLCGPTFGPLVETCKRYGIRRTMAFALAREKLIDVFHVKSRTFVTFASLDSLPERLQAGLRGES